MTSSECWVGIDGGGTKTKVHVISTTGLLLGESIFGSSNQNSVGLATAQENLKTALMDSLKQANRLTTDVKGLCAGMSGVDRPNDVELMESFFKSLTSENCKIYICNDGVLALAAGTSGDLHGIVQISGTGAITVGFNKYIGTDQVRASGWGPLIGEDGSGYTIGSDVIVAVARAFDGMIPPTRLTECVLAQLNLKTPKDLIPWRYSDLSWARVAELAPLAYQAAKEGDEAALNILHKNVNGLINSITAVFNNLKFSTSDKVPIVFSGGNLTFDGSILYELLSKNLLEKYPNVQILLPSMDPATAAAHLIINLTTKSNE